MYNTAFLMTNIRHSKHVEEKGIELKYYLKSAFCWLILHKRMPVVYIVHTSCIRDIFILLLNNCTFVVNKLPVILFYTRSSQYSGYYYRPHNFTEV
jgi:hypothetical protein